MRWRALRERLGDRPRLERGGEHACDIERGLARAFEARLQRPRIYRALREVVCEMQEGIGEQHVEVREAIRREIRRPLELARERLRVVGRRAEAVLLRSVHRAEQVPGERFADALPVPPRRAPPAICVELREDSAFGERLPEGRARGRREHGLDLRMQVRVEGRVLRGSRAICARDDHCQRCQNDRAAARALREVGGT